MPSEYTFVRIAAPEELCSACRRRLLRGKISKCWTCDDDAPADEGSRSDTYFVARGSVFKQGSRALRSISKCTCQTQAKPRKAKFLPIRSILDTPSPKICESLDEDIGDVALNMICRTYFAYDSKLIPEGAYYDCVRSLYSTSLSTSSIHLVTKATGLSMLSKDPQKTAVKSKAMATYNQAVKTVAAALQDYEESRSNETLFAVMMLALYESRTATEVSAENFERHLSGVQSLLCLRGDRNWADAESGSMSRVIRSQLIMRCIQNSKSPEDLGMGRFWLNLYDSLDVDPHGFHNLASRVALLRSSIEEACNHTDSNIDEDLVESIIEDGIKLDADLCEWQRYKADSANSPVTYNATPSEIEDMLQAGLFWPGPIHFYHDFFASGNINQCRSFRILTRVAILRATQLLAEQFGNEGWKPWVHAESIRTIQDMVDEICSSVPYHLDQLQCDEPGANQPNPQHGAYILLWPVHVASTAPGLKVSQRMWLHELLRIMGSKGSKIAHMLAETRPLSFSGEVVFKNIIYPIPPQHL